jgi:integrase
MDTISKQAGKKTSPKYIRGLSCPDHLKQIYECVLPDVHLYISVARAGTKSFTFRRKVNGSWRTLDLNCKFVDSLDDTACRLTIEKAKEKASVLTARVSRGEDPFTEREERQSEPSLQELFDHYKRGHLEKKAKRVSDITNDFVRWFGKVAKRKVSAFSHADANQLHERMKTTPYSANRAMQLGGAIFNYARKTKMITLFKETPRGRFLSNDEAGRLLTAVSSAPLKHCLERTLADFAMLSLMTGVRKMNLLTMRWDEIDQNPWTWTVPASKMKNGKAQTIPLGATEIGVLEQRQKLLNDAEIVSPWVFPSDRSKSGHLEDIAHSWETLRKGLGLADLTLHDLRRSLASAMANSGANVAIIQSALNHADMKTTLNAYIKTTQQAQLDARQKAQQGWFDAAEKNSSQLATTVELARVAVK